jgi:hypothetical protein
MDDVAGRAVVLASALAATGGALIALDGDDRRVVVLLDRVDHRVVTSDPDDLRRLDAGIEVVAL